MGNGTQRSPEKFPHRADPSLKISNFTVQTLSLRLIQDGALPPNGPALQDSVAALRAVASQLRLGAVWSPRFSTVGLGGVSGRSYTLKRGETTLRSRGLEHCRCCDSLVETLVVRRPGAVYPGAGWRPVSCCGFGSLIAALLPAASQTGKFRATG